MPQCLPESLRTRLPVTLTPVERMNPVREHWDRKCLKSCPSHLAGHWEPVVPPRVADGKAAVIFGQIACIKEVAIEAVTCSCRLDTLTYIHAPSDDACAVQAAYEPMGQQRVRHHSAVRIDDASNRRATVANGLENSPEARLSVFRQPREFDRHVKILKLFDLASRLLKFQLLELCEAFKGWVTSLSCHRKPPEMDRRVMLWPR